uniref:Uncharacterized protein n=1 Tax=viral metagenome TaxID=1070528 RepID=A0A6C0EL59_9ZZZZ
MNGLIIILGMTATGKTTLAQKFIDKTDAYTIITSHRHDYANFNRNRIFTLDRLPEIMSQPSGGTIVIELDEKIWMEGARKSVNKISSNFRSLGFKRCIFTMKYLKDFSSGSWQDVDHLFILRCKQDTLNQLRIPQTLFTHDLPVHLTRDKNRDWTIGDFDVKTT